MIHLQLWNLWRVCCLLVIAAHSAVCCAHTIVLCTNVPAAPSLQSPPKPGGAVESALVERFPAFLHAVSSGKLACPSRETQAVKPFVSHCLSYKSGLDPGVNGDCTFLSWDEAGSQTLLQDLKHPASRKFSVCAWLHWIPPLDTPCRVWCGT